MSNEQKLCEVVIFQLRSMPNAIKCIDQVLQSRILVYCCSQEFWYIVSCLDIKLEHLRTTIVTAKNRFKVAKCEEPCSVFL